MTDNLPKKPNEPPEKAPWLDEVDTHILEVTRHDVEDVVIGRQYYVLFIEDEDDGRFIVSDMSSPVTTEYS